MDPTNTTHSPLTQITKTTRIGVLYGGLSNERAVSLRSGSGCVNALKRLGYENVHGIDVGHNIATVLQELNIEVAYLALHGKYGEDGSIQGLLDILGIPYTGNPLAASAITMNKDLTKRLLDHAQLPVLQSTLLDFSQNNTQQTIPAIQYQGTYPVIVKPIAEGSSVGMSKAANEIELNAAVERAAQFASQIMIEPFIPGKSITVGVIEINGEPTVTPILELRSKNEWYDEEAKYTKGLTEFILPAELPDDVTQAIQDTTIQAHTTLGCRGVSRTDYIVDGENRFYILEVNTIPGMTDLSDLPAQAQAMGISYDQLVEYILQGAIR